MTPQQITLVQASFAKVAVAWTSACAALSRMMIAAAYPGEPS